MTRSSLCHTYRHGSHSGLRSPSSSAGTEWIFLFQRRGACFVAYMDFCKLHTTSNFGISFTFPRPISGMFGSSISTPSGASMRMYVFINIPISESSFSVHLMKLQVVFCNIGTKNSHRCVLYNRCKSPTVIHPVHLLETTNNISSFRKWNDIPIFIYFLFLDKNTSW